MSTIKKLRRMLRAGFTQQKLADKVGVSFQSLNAWLNKRATPRDKQKEKINSLYEELFGARSIDTTALEKKKASVRALRNKNMMANIRKNKSILDRLLLTMTYNTNAVEGSTLTESDTAEIIFKNKTLPNHTLTEQLEASNHKKAFFLAFSIAQKRAISEQDILDLHKVLMAGILENAGCFRAHSVRILGTPVPTANPLSIRSKTRSLLREINKKSKDDIAFLARIHAIFEQIHPFSDGNGRVGRLLLLVLAMRVGLPPAVVVYERKHAYYNALQKAQLDSNFSFMEDFVCDAICGGARVVGL